MPQINRVNISGYTLVEMAGITVVQKYFDQTVSLEKMSWDISFTMPIFGTAQI